MAIRKSINFLPTIFQTDVNKKFFNATLDQLISEPNLRTVDGYIGRTFAPTYKANDSYVLEVDESRQNYQLEASVVVRNSVEKITFFSSYTDLLNKISYYGGPISDHSRLFESEYYSYDPMINLDKFVNFGQYYWLEDGPDAVDVNTSGVEIEETYTVSRNLVTNRYNFVSSNGATTSAPTFARGGLYKFIVDQPGIPFWIQSERGVDGLNNNIITYSTREVLGVTNNGTDNGEITFAVPQENAQDVFINMEQITEVDYALPLVYTDIHNIRLSDFKLAFPEYNWFSELLNGRTFIFMDQQKVNIPIGDWTAPSVYDDQAVELTTFGAGTVIPFADRNHVWQILFVLDGTGNTDPVMRLVPSTQIAVDEKVYIRYGETFANREFYKKFDEFFYIVPVITAVQPTLYYQDGISAAISGTINLVETSGWSIDVDNDIIDRLEYTSPNGVQLTNGLKVVFGTDVEPASYQNLTYYVEGVGSSIQLVDITLLVRPELYNDELTVNFPDELFPEYLTINRSSLDLNAWTRNNRWFHREVVELTAGYNNTIPVIDQDLRANRPILEFDKNIQMFNEGRVGKRAVDILDTTVTDAFNETEGQIQTFEFGVPLVSGMRIIFAADKDPLVNTGIFVLTLEQYEADTLGNPIGDIRVKLTKAADGDIVANNSVVVTDGTYKGDQWWYNGTDWLQSQQKTQSQQAPLFDIFDSRDISLANFVTGGTSFTGTKLFGFRENPTGVTDPILGFPLSYKNFTTQGDIEFTNYYDHDTFIYSVDDGDDIVNNISIGGIQKFVDTTTIVNHNVWNTVNEQSKQYQLISFIHTGLTSTFEIDITPNTQITIPYVKVFLNNTALRETTDWVRTDKSIEILATLAVDDKVDILVYSDEVSNLAFYQVPLNIDLNAQNVDLETLTLGQIRNHLVALRENSTDITGNILAASNLRDKDIRERGGNILQHSGPLPYASLFLLDDAANFVDGVAYASREYAKFKYKFLELSKSLSGVDPQDPPASVDLILTAINEVKTVDFPWYYSDMVPYGASKNEISYTIFNPLIRSYEITEILDDTVLSNRAILVYLNGLQLVKDRDYIFEQDRPAILIRENITLEIDDVLKFAEYDNTDGNYIPDTPSKLGLYHKYYPIKFLDDSYQTPIDVICGHDGSITPSFGDFRDDFLLELEKRIYNNIKVADNAVTDELYYNTVPGKFRNSDYTLEEFNNVLNSSFLAWVGNNRLDFSANETFQASEPFTWNYDRLPDRIDGELLPGSWRACYRYYYDTINPNLTPWEMLGFTVMPEWWESYYGGAPYTGGNELLWEDLEAGLIKEGSRAGIDERFVRPGLSQSIPVDANGNLLSPTAIMAATFNPGRTASAWASGMMGPVEASWRASSEYPFAVQKAMAILKPARYFGTLAGVSHYVRDLELNQIVDKESGHHIRQTDILLNGNVNADFTIDRSAGYLNWIADYLTSQGMAATTIISQLLENYDVNLAYRMAGFSDKGLIKVLAEQSSPSSTNESVLVPDENYHVYLAKSAPVNRLSYSAVVIEKTNSGYVVKGYDTNNPYFTIIPSVVNSNSNRIKVLDKDAVVFYDFQPKKINVPYGSQFSTHQQVVDFLISYQRYLEAQGFTFNRFDEELIEAKDWKLSVREFLYWIQQGWKPSSILILSPVASQIDIVSENSVSDKISNKQYASRLLDQNFKLLKNSKYNVMRDESGTTVNVIDTGSVICYAEIDLVQYEHVLLFDNVTVFDDVIYKPELGNRQFRLRVVGKKTDEWDGSLYAPGFIYQSGELDDWTSGRDYLKGDIVLFKTKPYVALENSIAASDFNYAEWKQLEKDELKSGLLPNWSTLAKKPQSYYDSYGELNTQDDIEFGHALIGFKPRSYLDELGINETTQIELYKGFIKQKGTANAINEITGTEFKNLQNDVTFYEDWAVRVGEYGAIDTNPFLEIELDELAYSVNPALVNFASAADADAADGITMFAEQHLHKSSNQYNGTIVLDRDSASDYSNDIATAGYVRIDDTNTTIFSLENYLELNNVLADVGRGYTIWCAKDLAQQWNVFRVTETNNTVTEITNALDGYITVKTLDHHNLEVDDIFVILGFELNYNGFFRVDSVDALNEVTVQTTNDNQTLTSIEGTGSLYTLESVRFDYMNDVDAFNPLNQWQPDEKIWVDKNVATVDSNINTWNVYKKTIPWDFKESLDKSSHKTNNGFGQAITTTVDGLIALVSETGLNVVHTFIKTTEDNFIQGTTILADGNDTATYGQSIVTSADRLAVGAPGSNNTNGYVYIYDKDVSAAFNRSQIIPGNLTAKLDTSTITFTGNISLADPGEFITQTVSGANAQVVGQPTLFGTMNFVGNISTASVNDYITQSVSSGNAQITSTSTLFGNVNFTGNISLADPGEYITQAVSGANIAVISQPTLFGTMNFNGNISTADVGEYITQTVSGANAEVTAQPTLFGTMNFVGNISTADVGEFITQTVSGANAEVTAQPTLFGTMNFVGNISTADVGEYITQTVSGANAEVTAQPTLFGNMGFVGNLEVATTGDYITQDVSGANAEVTTTPLLYGTMDFVANITANIGEYITQSVSSANALVITANVVSGTTATVQFITNTFTTGSGNIAISGGNVDVYPTTSTVTSSVVDVEYLSAGGPYIKFTTGSGNVAVNASDVNVYPSSTSVTSGVALVEYLSGGPYIKFTNGSGNVAVDATNVAAYPSASTVTTGVALVEYLSGGPYIKFTNGSGNVAVDATNVAAYPSASSVTSGVALVEYLSGGSYIKFTDASGNVAVNATNVAAYPTSTTVTSGAAAVQYITVNPYVKLTNGSGNIAINATNVASYPTSTTVTSGIVDVEYVSAGGSYIKFTTGSGNIAINAGNLAVYPTVSTVTSGIANVDYLAHTFAGLPSYMTIGSGNVAVNATNVAAYPLTETITANREQFGSSISMSSDNKWLYVGAIAANRVYIYGTDDTTPTNIQVESVNNNNSITMSGTITAAAGQYIIQPATGAQVQLIGNVAASNTAFVNVLTNIVTGVSGGNLHIATRNAEDDGFISNVDANVTAISTSSIPETDTITLGFTPHEANAAVSLHITTGIKTYIPELDYTLLGNVISFTTAIGNGGFLPVGDVVVRQQPYFVLVDTIQGTIGSGFGDSVEASADSLQFVVTAPNATVQTTETIGTLSFGNVVSVVTGDYITQETTGANAVVRISSTGTTANVKYLYGTFAGGNANIFVNGNNITSSNLANLTLTGLTTVANVLSSFASAGTAYLYDRQVESFTSTGVKEYTTTGNIGDVRRVTINGEETSRYTVPSVNTMRLNVVSPAGNTIEVETNAIRLVEQITQLDPQTDAKFGTSLSICPFGCALYIGEPYYNENNIRNTGAVIKFHNKSKLYGSTTGTEKFPLLTIGHSIRLNNVEVTATGTTLDSFVADINNTNNLGITAINEDDFLRLDSTRTVTNNKIRVGTGIGTLVSDLGLPVFEEAQLMTNPFDTPGENFGDRITISASGDLLLIGTEGGTTIATTTFDLAETRFDNNSISFSSFIPRSGSAYVYESYDDPRSNPDFPTRFTYTQQLNPGDLNINDDFGSAVHVRDNNIFVVAKDDDMFGPDTGSLYRFKNADREKGWNLLRNEEDQVDVDTINRVFMYDTTTQHIIIDLQIFDPAKGKILGFAEQEISFAAEFDPAVYNRGTNEEANINDNLFWNTKQIGKVWWNLDTLRYIDYEQGSLTYRQGNWGSLFPGSIVEVCEWVESDVLPSSYSGDGEPKYVDDSAYVEITFVDSITNTIRSKYYYWVTGKSSYDQNNITRNIPLETIKGFIEAPKTQGVPYIAVIKNSAIATYNIDTLLTDNTVLHVDHELLKNNNIIHSEYELIQEGNPNTNIVTRLEDKIIDSLSGVDAYGNLVPDPELSDADKLGILTRPRQSMFVDQQKALREYIEYVNGVLITTPVAVQTDLSALDSQSPKPKSSEYGVEVDTDVDLQYLNPLAYSTGFKVLVIEDTTQNNLWTVYELDEFDKWDLIQVQGFKTSLFWNYVDWFETGYSSLTKVDFIAATTLTALTLPYAPGDLIKIEDAGKGQWQVILVNASSKFDVVGIENGTIAVDPVLAAGSDTSLGFDNQRFSEKRFDQQPGQEAREIFTTLKNDIFVDELYVQRNKSIFVLMNYIFSEQPSVDWVFKTSFIDVIHKLRNLEQYPNYIRDNQTYYEDYIAEVKPATTSIREYLIQYDANDLFDGVINDFDLPGYFDRDLNMFRSPSGEIVPKDTQLQATGYIGNELINDQYPLWYANRHGEVMDIIIVNPGLGYTEEPTITVEGGGVNAGGVTANVAVDFDTGSLISITVTRTGSGFSESPTVIINGGANVTATAYATIKNNQVRSINTDMRFDRIGYSSQVRRWAANTSIFSGDLISHNGVCYQANANVTAGTTFNSDNYDVYHIDNFVSSNVAVTYGAADRILANYNPTDGMTQIETTEKELSVKTATGGMIFTGDFVANIGATINQGEIASARLLAISSINGTMKFASNVFSTSTNDYITQTAGAANAQAISNSTLTGNISFAGDLEARANDFITQGSGNALVLSRSLNVGNVTVNGDLSANIGDLITQPLPTGTISRITGATTKFGNITLEANLTADFTANIGEYITQALSGANALVTLSPHDITTAITTVKVEYISGSFTIGDGPVATTGGWTGNLFPTQTTVTSSTTPVEYVYSRFTTGAGNVYIQDGVILNGIDSVDVNAYPTIATVTSSQVDVQYNNDVFTLAANVSVNGVDANIVPSAKTVMSSVDVSILTNTFTTGNANVFVNGVDANIAISTFPITTATTNIKYLYGTFTTGSGNVTINGTDINAYPASLSVAANTTVFLDSVVDVFSGMYITGNGANLATITSSVFDATTGDKYIVLDRPQTFPVGTLITANYDNLSQILTGVDYPGVEISGVDFNQQVGFGNNYDLSTYDNVTYDADGNAIFDESVLDTIIRSTYTDASLGIRAEDIIVDGGAYVDDYSSHAPEELVPGIVFDTLDMKIYTKVSGGANTEIAGYRVFSDMLHIPEYIRIADSATTILTQPLLLTDTEIHVGDASVLLVPSPSNTTPGVIFIGAERITYYTLDATTNTLGQLRRGTSGTGAPTEHTIGTEVQNASFTEEVPDLAIIGEKINDIQELLNAGTVTAVDGTGLDGSTTSAANFIKGQPAAYYNVDNVLAIENTVNIFDELLITESGDTLITEN